jgi:VanZ family protein
MSSSLQHPEDERGLWFARTWAALYLALVILVSLVPSEFGVGRRRLLRHLGEMVLFLNPRWAGGTALTSLRDFTTNVLLYLPLGLLCAWTLRKPRLRVAGAGFLISLALEVLQAATRDRTASLLDVVANGLGHASGYALSFWLIQHRGLSPAVFVGGRGQQSLAGLAGALRSAYVTALFALSLLPYDVTVSAGRIWSKALGDGSEPGRIYLFFATPWNRSRVAGALLTLCLVAVFGFLSWLAARESARPSAGKLACQGLLVAGSIEAAQVVVSSRTADVVQVVAGSVGAILGALLARQWAKTVTKDGVGRPVRAVRTGLLVAAALWTLAVWSEAWLPFELTSSWKDAGRKLVFGTYWLPLSAYAHQRSLADWQDLGREVGIYIPLGLLLGAWADRGSSRWPWSHRRLAPAIGIAALGCALEMSQCMISGRTVDMTDAISHALGGVIGLYLASLLSPAERDVGRDRTAG